MEQLLQGKEIILLGGDQREKYLANFLAEQGAKLKVLAKADDFLASQKEIELIAEFSEVKSLQADVVIAPMTGVDQQYRIKNTFVDYPVQLDEAFFKDLAIDSKFLIGLADEKLKRWANSSQIELIELATLDQLAILNAVPTAEAAISIAINQSRLTLAGNNSFVLGLGRVGLTLARRLEQLGSKTYGVARKDKDLARAKEMGLKPLHFKDLSAEIKQADFIFNTVPALVLNRSILEQVKLNGLIIDLASAPGGTDFKAAQKLGISAELALGLPGKTAPESAGKIIAEIIPRLILEE